MTPEEFFEKWWIGELPVSGFNKTAMLDFAELYATSQWNAAIEAVDKKSRYYGGRITPDGASERRIITLRELNDLKK